MIRYAITDRFRLGSTEAERRSALLRLARHWAADGMDYVQLREKDLAPAALSDLARELIAVLHAPELARTPKLLINSRADVALAVGADGVHLPSAPAQLTPAQIRRLYSVAGLPEPAISISCHTVAEVTHARDSGADLILFGPVFEKAVWISGSSSSVTRVAEGVGLDLVHEACAAAAPVPVLALGGITVENAAACLRTGASGVASIRLFKSGPAV